MMIDRITEQREALYKLVSAATEANHEVAQLGRHSRACEVLDDLQSAESFVTEAVIALSNALSCLTDAGIDLILNEEDA